MSTRKEGAALVGVGAIACAACCAGPIVGLLAAIGLGTAAGVALFGTIALVFGAIALTFVLGRRRRSLPPTCEPGPVPVDVALQRLEGRSEERQPG